MKSVSDDEAGRLWDAFLEGDRPQGFEAFERLYLGLLPIVLRYCRFRLRDPHRAEDAAETVFVRLLERRPQVRSSFIGLLLRTARNICNSAVTKPHLHPVPDVSISQDPTHAMEESERSAALAECLSRLSERSQALVVLRHGEGLTYRQIREVLGLGAAFSTLSRRLKALLAKLRRCLEEKNIF